MDAESMSTPDIVARLRDAGECPTPLRAYLARAVVLQAADEIERLRTQLEMWQDGNIMAESHHDEIKRLTAERDEARQEVSYLRPSVCLGAQTANEYARERGWDCFKEER
jgi:uncharacterized small protein (DUF1192 family)